jgi:quinol monooxygenase YgiN
MSDEVIYLDQFQLREGKLAEFEQFAREMAEFVEENEPGAISFNYYMDEEGGKGTAVFVFSDADAMDRHLELASSKFQKAYELVGESAIELLGRPSDRAIEMAAAFNASLRSNLAGFNRF